MRIRSVLRIKINLTRIMLLWLVSVIYVMYDVLFVLVLVFYLLCISFVIDVWRAQALSVIKDNYWRRICRLTGANCCHYTVRSSITLILRTRQLSVFLHRRRSSISNNCRVCFLFFYLFISFLWYLRLKWRVGQSNFFHRPSSFQ